MYYMEIELYEGGSIRNLQALLLFEVLDLMKFYMVLIGMALSVYGHVSQGICTDVPVEHGNPLGKLVLLWRWRSDTAFCSTVIDNVILLHDNVRLHTAQQAM